MRPKFKQTAFDCAGDVCRVVLRSFQNLLFYMESESIIQCDNEQHLFALHFVYLPRINSSGYTHLGFGVFRRVDGLGLV